MWLETPSTFASFFIPAFLYRHRTSSERLLYVPFMSCVYGVALSFTFIKNYHTYLHGITCTIFQNTTNNSTIWSSQSKSWKFSICTPVSMFLRKVNLRAVTLNLQTFQVHGSFNLTSWRTNLIVKLFYYLKLIAI